MRKLVLLGLLVVLFVASGCEAFRLSRDTAALPPVRPPKSPIQRYFEDRLLDLLDIFVLNVAAGEGILVHAMATKIAQAGLGIMADCDRYGFVSRSFGRWWEERGEIGVSLAYLSNSHRKPLIYNKFLYDWCVDSKKDEVSDIDIFRNTDRDFWDIRATVFVLFFGLEIGIRPKELFDALWGILTIDFMRDDEINRMRKPEKGGLMKSPTGAWEGVALPERAQLGPTYATEFQK
ncbi:MAG: hypothetical protein N2234_06400 [Planctomycetota bacterium]|nr:hypothetical protein [Planctomycetota bacterium]